MSVTKKPKAAAAPPTDSPIDIVVRRGALRRFDQLKQKAADLPVRLSWDRRVATRRSDTSAVEAERRRADRRRSPPFTWHTADFVIVGDGTRTPPGNGASTGSKRRRG